MLSENPSNSANGLNLSCQTTGWELALVTAPSSSGAAVAESKLVSPNCYVTYVISLHLGLVSDNLCTIFVSYFPLRVISHFNIYALQMKPILKLCTFPWSVFFCLEPFMLQWASSTSFVHGLCCRPFICLTSCMLVEASGSAIDWLLSCLILEVMYISSLFFFYEKCLFQVNIWTNNCCIHGQVHQMNCFLNSKTSYITLIVCFKFCFQYVGINQQILWDSSLGVQCDLRKIQELTSFRSYEYLWLFLYLMIG